MRPNLASILLAALLLPACGSRMDSAGPGAAESAPVKLFSYFGGGSGEPETAWSFDFPRPDFVAGSYQGRKFLSPSNHLGDDSAHDHLDSVHAIADGVVQEAIPANGYGRVVVIQHKLPDGSYVSSIYGHLCSHRRPPVREGEVVKKGDVIGYVGDQDENGDGLEHIHLGLRKGRYDGYFCGYARAPFCTPDYYHSPTEFIRARSGGMKSTAKIQSFPMDPGSRDLTFKVAVTNGFFYGGAFEFRLHVMAGDKVRFTSEILTRKLDRGASASLLFPTTLTDARTPRAVVELRAPGTATWQRVEDATARA